MKPVTRFAGHETCRGTGKDKFQAAPAAYRDGNPPEAAPAPQGTLYTCPMHPEIVQDAFGSCPLCGMALESMGLPIPGEENPVETNCESDANRETRLTG